MATYKSGFFVKINNNLGGDFHGPYDFLSEAREEAKRCGRGSEIFQGSLRCIEGVVVDSSALNFIEVL